MTTPFVNPDGIHNPTIGAAIPPEWGDTVNDGLNFLAYRPGCVIQRTTNQTVNNTTFTPVQWNAADLRDTDDYHNPATNNTRIFIPANLGGLYQVGCNIPWAASSATGSARVARIRVNGSTYIMSDDRMGVTNASYATSNAFSFLYPFAGGDYIEFMGYQTTGGTLNILAASLPCVAWCLLEAVI